MRCVTTRDDSVDDRDEVASDQRHASGRPGCEQLIEPVDLGGVRAANTEVAESNGKFLIRDASIGPVIRGDVERTDDLRLGKHRNGPEQRRQCTVMGTVTNALGCRGVAVAQHNREAVNRSAYPVLAALPQLWCGEAKILEESHWITLQAFYEFQCCQSELISFPGPHTQCTPRVPPPWRVPRFQTIPSSPIETVSNSQHPALRQG